MAHFVLLHGAWHGGWCWDGVATRLQERGHHTSQPTYSGLAERAHLLSDETGLDKFEQDIVELFIKENLSNVTLVGHSFGGIIATIVADRLADRIRHLVFLDADIAVDSLSTFDLMPPDIVSERMATQIEVNGVACMPCPTAEALGILDPQMGENVVKHLTPHPIKSYLDIVRLNNRPGAGLDGDFILCTRPDYGMMDQSKKLARDIGLTFGELATGHDAMITEPDSVVNMLCR